MASSITPRELANDDNGRNHAIRAECLELSLAALDGDEEKKKDIVKRIRDMFH